MRQISKWFEIIQRTFHILYDFYWFMVERLGFASNGAQTHSASHKMMRNKHALARIITNADIVFELHSVSCGLQDLPMSNKFMLADFGRKKPIWCEREYWIATARIAYLRAIKFNSLSVRTAVGVPVHVEMRDCARSSSPLTEPGTHRTHTHTT